jgi:hypothetical protein
MAVITGKHEWIAKGVLKSTWLAVLASSTGTALAAPNLPDKTVQVFGSFFGVTITLEGSNDAGTTWFTLNDTRGEGNALTFTSADGRMVNENPELIRVSTGSGDSGGTTSVAIIITSSSGRR